MPLYDFECNACHERFEALILGTAEPTCPACGAGDSTRLYSTFSSPPKFGLRGADARRSNATRRVREEQRSKRREQRRQQRES